MVLSVCDHMLYSVVLLCALVTLYMYVSVLPYWRIHMFNIQLAKVYDWCHK